MVYILYACVVCIDYVRYGLRPSVDIGQADRPAVLGPPTLSWSRFAPSRGAGGDGVPARDVRSGSMSAKLDRERRRRGMGKKGGWGGGVWGELSGVIVV